MVPGCVTNLTVKQNRTMPTTEHKLTCLLAAASTQQEMPKSVRFVTSAVMSPVGDVMKDKKKSNTVSTLYHQ